MSFGFSVGDIILCATLAHDLYEFLTNAPNECAEFRKNIDHFSLLVRHTANLMERDSTHLDRAEKLRIKDVINDSWDFMWIGLLGEPYRSEFAKKNMPTTESLFDNAQVRSRRKQFAERFRQWSLARKIPVHEKQLSRLTHRLEQFLIRNYDQRLEDIQGSLKALKDSECRKEQLLEQVQAGQHTIQGQLESSTLRLEESQARIESQLQQILTNHLTHVGSPSLQALNRASPEGQATWAAISRDLKNAGITSAKIQRHQMNVTAAIRGALNSCSPSSIDTTSSFYTAAEGSYASPNSRLALSSFEGGNVDPLDSTTPYPDQPLGAPESAPGMPSPQNDSDFLFKEFSSLIEGLQGLQAAAKMPEMPTFDDHLGVNDKATPENVTGPFQLPYPDD